MPVLTPPQALTEHTRGGEAGPSWGITDTASRPTTPHLGVAAAPCALHRVPPQTQPGLAWSSLPPKGKQGSRREAWQGWHEWARPTQKDPSLFILTVLMRQRQLLTAVVLGAGPKSWLPPLPASPWLPTPGAVHFETHLGARARRGPLHSLHHEPPAGQPAAPAKGPRPGALGREQVAVAVGQRTWRPALGDCPGVPAPTAPRGPSRLK